MTTILAHQKRQTIAVKLPKSAGIARSIEVCGAAIRKKHKDMLWLAPRSWFGAARLLSIGEGKAVYEVWIRSDKESGCAA